jgi:hypothetical protein
MRPIAYRIFKGDTFEGQTFGATLVEEYTIDQVVVLTGECSAKQFGTSKRKRMRLYHRRKNKILTGIRTKIIS